MGEKSSVERTLRYNEMTMQPNNCRISTAPPSATYCITWARDGASLSSVPSSWLEKGEKLHSCILSPRCAGCGPLQVRQEKRILTRPA